MGRPVPKEARAPSTQDGFASSQEVLEQNPPEQNSFSANVFSSGAPAALGSHRSVVVCIIWERKPSPFGLRPQAPKPAAGQILPAGFPFPGPRWARAPWKVLD